MPSEPDPASTRQPAVISDIAAESAYDGVEFTAGGDDADTPCTFSTAGGPTTMIPELPMGALPLVAVALIGGAVVIRRRRRTPTR